MSQNIPVKYIILILILILLILLFFFYDGGQSEETGEWNNMFWNQAVWK